MRPQLPQGYFALLELPPNCPPKQWPHVHSSAEGNHPESFIGRRAAAHPLSVQKSEAVTNQVPEAVHGRVNKDETKTQLLWDSGADQSSLGPRPAVILSGEAHRISRSGWRRAWSFPPRRLLPLRQRSDLLWEVRLEPESGLIRGGPTVGRAGGTSWQRAQGSGMMGPLPSPPCAPARDLRPGKGADLKRKC